MGVYEFLRPALFALPPEPAHRLTLRALQMAAHLPGSGHDDYVLSQNIMGLDFANPLGMAAGFDKDGEAMAGIGKVGFGFTEVGTVTPLPQDGNPRPRVFRLPAQKALINRLGFNNKGQVDALHRLSVYRAKPRSTGGPIIGINIGANKDAEDRIADYETGAARFASLADYLTVNISSPNTPGLRDLQASSAVSEIMQRVRAAAPDIPVLVKIAPDLEIQQAQEIAALAVKFHIDGLIISNTTLSRDGVADSKHATQDGGVSGQPVFEMSTHMLGQVYQASQGALTLIGVGGVSNGRQAYEKICAGASLVQLYTAMIYHGPFLASQVKRQLADLVRANGFQNIGEAVGSDFK
ncbi:quinone-dependent dihydroorotate dehydrogenase [Alphaproteobacteria bacterium]|nr:quinone-dependent dihydroorotate dehydrogenase [Alphaproteobacteria bacterium]